MNSAQVSAFQANAGFSAGEVSVVLLSLVFAVLLLWGVWALPMSVGPKNVFLNVSSLGSRCASSRCTWC